MTTKVYLDTARLGLMTPQAQHAASDFVRFAGGEGCSPNFDEFLRHGIEVLPASMRQKYAGLADWHGLAHFKDSLRSLTGTTSGFNLLLANRSAQLMRLAARLLFLRCRRPLVTDLEWPGYLSILERERQICGGQISHVQLRSIILDDRCSPSETLELIGRRYLDDNCDGIFLSAVSFDGIRLPVHEILDILPSARPPRFVVLDGAQAIGHIPTNLAIGDCDFYIAGCHKWLQAHFPLGLGFCPRRGSQSFITAVRQQMMRDGELDDPLLHFADQIESGSTQSFTETVAVSSLYPCAAAVAESLQTKDSMAQYFANLVCNVREIETIAAGTGWTPLLPDESFRSAVLLLRAEHPQTRRANSEALRQAFQSHGVALTAYDAGVIRVSSPTSQRRPPDLDLIRSALRQCA